MCVTALAVKLEQAERDGSLPKVVVPVHLTGSSCDMRAIGSLAQRYGFAVLEDASHAVGGRYLGEPVGNCRHSAITVFSFHPVKIITTGEGGLATTNDPLLAQQMAELRSHGIVREAKRFSYPAAGPWVYEQQQLGFNYRMTDILAALGLSQLQKLDAFVAERNRQLQRYRELLTNLPVHLLKVPEGVLSSVHLAVIRTEQANPMQHRRIFEGLRGAGIGVQLHYSPVHQQPYYRSLGGVTGKLPEAEAYGHSAISLPIFPGLTMPEQDRIVQELKTQIALA
jgi:dTDP-4-amino-4,6-dideoxygalactose transaminase